VRKATKSLTIFAPTLVIAAYASTDKEAGKAAGKSATKQPTNQQQSSRQISSKAIDSKTPNRQKQAKG